MEDICAIALRIRTYICWSIEGMLFFFHYPLEIRRRQYAIYSLYLCPNWTHNGMSLGGNLSCSGGLMSSKSPSFALLKWSLSNRKTAVRLLNYVIKASIRSPIVYFLIAQSCHLNPSPPIFSARQVKSIWWSPLKGKNIVIAKAMHETGRFIRLPKR